MGHAMPIYDVVTHDARFGPGLAAEIHQALADRRFDRVIVDDSRFFFNLFSRTLARHYVFSEELFEDASVFAPVTGFATRPQFVFVLKATNSGEEGSEHRRPEE